MAVTVLYFAQIQQDLGIAQQQLEYVAGETAQALLQRLAAQHDYAFPVQDLRLALNESFAEWSTVVNDGDVLALISPVAGG